MLRRPHTPTHTSAPPVPAQQFEARYNDAHFLTGAPYEQYTEELVNPSTPYHTSASHRQHLDVGDALGEQWRELWDAGPLPTCDGLRDSFPPASSIFGEESSLVTDSLQVLDRQIQLARNYTCCGHELDDLHALLEHFEEDHVILIGPTGEEVSAQCAASASEHRHRRTQSDRDDDTVAGHLDRQRLPACPESDGTSYGSPSNTGRPSNVPQPTPPPPRTSYTTSNLLPSHEPAFYTTHIFTKNVATCDALNNFTRLEKCYQREDAYQSPLLDQARMLTGQQDDHLSVTALTHTADEAFNSYISGMAPPGSSQQADVSVAHSGALAPPFPSQNPAQSGFSDTTGNTGSFSTVEDEDGLAIPPAFLESLAPLFPYKPYRCPNPNCVKAYKQSNGLRYHVTRGSCKPRANDDTEAIKQLVAKLTQKTTGEAIKPETEEIQNREWTHSRSGNSEFIHFET
ncbi:hypothetical protein BV20DRAFT_982121 [Pilatotrama ljubarskyi]|nr:hypothetical protein BV20DRAFT_982121 [Pilatotrama ljubarskyi]